MAVSYPSDERATLSAAIIRPVAAAEGYSRGSEMIPTFRGAAVWRCALESSRSTDDPHVRGADAAAHCDTEALEG